MSQSVPRVRLDLTHDDVLGALTPMMESPDELSEADLRKTIDMVTLQPGDPSFEGLLRTSQRYGLLIDLAEGKVPQPTAEPSQAAGPPATSSRSAKKKGKSKGAKAEAGPSSSKDTGMTISVARQVAGPGASGSPTLIIKNAPDKPAMPPVNLSPHFIQYLRQPEVIARMKACRKTMWETCTAGWDYQNIPKSRRPNASQISSGFVDTITQAAVGSATARKVAAGASVGDQLVAGLGASAGARLGMQAAIKDAMADGHIPQQASPSGFSALQMMLQPPNTPAARAAVMMAELTGETSGYGLARSCAQTGILPPNLVNKEVKLHRAKVKYEILVGEVKYEVRKLLDEGAAFGMEPRAAKKGGEGKKRAEKTEDQAGKAVAGTGRVLEVPRTMSSIAASGRAGSSSGSDGKERRRGQYPTPGRVIEVPRVPSSSSGSPATRKERGRPANAGRPRAGEGRVLEVPRNSGSQGGSRSSADGSASSSTGKGAEGSSEGDEAFARRIIDVQRLGRGLERTTISRGESSRQRRQSGSRDKVREMERRSVEEFTREKPGFRGL